MFVDALLRNPLGPKSKIGSIVPETPSRSYQTNVSNRCGHKARRQKLMIVCVDRMISLFHLSWPCRGVVDIVAHRMSLVPLPRLHCVRLHIKHGVWAKVWEIELPIFILTWWFFFQVNNYSLTAPCFTSHPPDWIRHCSWYRPAASNESDLILQAPGKKTIISHFYIEMNIWLFNWNFYLQSRSNFHIPMPSLNLVMPPLLYPTANVESKLVLRAHGSWNGLPLFNFHLGFIFSNIYLQHHLCHVL